MRGGFSYNIMRHHCGFLVETIKNVFSLKKSQGFCYMSCPFMSHVLFLIRVVLNISFWDLKCFFVFSNHLLVMDIQEGHFIHLIFSGFCEASRPGSDPTTAVTQKKFSQEFLFGEDEAILVLIFFK